MSGFHKYGKPQPDSDRRPLSTAEQKVLQLAADGLGTIATAKELGVAEGTVKKYRMHLMMKLGADSAAQAVAMGLRRGIIE